MSRPPIPAAVARQLRQVAGFGCCKCGLPIFDYHHIVPYHADDPYPPGEMMIVCPNHHRAAGSAITPDEQWELRRIRTTSRLASPRVSSSCTSGTRPS